MTIVNSVKTLAPGIGSSDFYASNVGVNANTGGATVVSLALAPAGQAGKVRIKTATIGVNGTIKVNNIIASDGTNNVVIYNGDANTSANGAAIDEVWEWITNINVNTININVTVANNNGTVDAEVVYAV